MGIHMNPNERLLYQQVHPFKIMVDLAAVTSAMVLLWRYGAQAAIWAVMVLLLPTSIATLLVVNVADLERIKESRLGEYVKRYLTRTVELARSAGVGVMIIGAWYHMPWVIAAGVLIAVGALLSGVFFPE